MTWFKVDDKFAFHSKALAAGNEAIGAWVRAGAWSSGELTDGAIPAHVATMLAPPEVWERLVASRLVERTDAGYQMHDFLLYNPSGEQVEARAIAKREARQRAGKIGGVKSGEARRQTAKLADAATVNGEANEANAKQTNEARASVVLRPGVKQNEAPSRPVPSRDLTHTAREAEPTDPNAVAVLAALRSHKALAEIATVSVAENVAGYLLQKPKPLPLVLSAIDDLARNVGAAAAAGEFWPAPLMSQKLAGYIERAKPPRDDAPRPGTRTYAAPEPVRTGTRLLTFDDPPRAPRQPPRPASTTDATVPGDALALVAGIGLGGRS